MKTVFGTIAVVLFFPHLHGFNSFIRVNQHLLKATMTSCVILFCHFSRKNFLTKFLSHRLWIPFEKIGYSFYLMHINVIIGPLVSRKKLVDFDGTIFVSIVFLFVSNTSFCFQNFSFLQSFMTS